MTHVIDKSNAEGRQRSGPVQRLDRVPGMSMPKPVTLTGFLCCGSGFHTRSHSPKIRHGHVSVGPLEQPLKWAGILPPRGAVEPFVGRIEQVVEVENGT